MGHRDLRIPLSDDKTFPTCISFAANLLTPHHDRSTRRKATDGPHSTAPRSAVDFIVQREANLIRTQMMLMLDQQAFDIAKQCVRASKFVSIKQLLVIHPIFEDSEKND